MLLSSLRMNKFSWYYQQLFLLLLLAIIICYAIPMHAKYDPFVMDGKIYGNKHFDLISNDSMMMMMMNDLSISNISALARSKRSCCGCCCCCCCWHVLFILIFIKFYDRNLGIIFNDNTMYSIENYFFFFCKKL